MDSELADLARMLRRLDDVEEIKKLKTRYCAACDGGWDGGASHDTEAIVSLFTEDGVWDGGVYGSRQGREALRAYYHQTRASEIPMAYHLLTNPVIEVAGDAATGSWKLTIFLTMPDGACFLVGGVFDDDYARTAEGWRIKRSRFTLAVNSRYDGTWAVSAAAEPPRGAA
jgi:hypothetical protein